MPRLHRTKAASSAPTPSTVRRRFRKGNPEAGAIVLADDTVTEPPPVAPPPQAATVTTDTIATPETIAMTDTIARPAPSGRTMLLVDLRGGLMLANEARYRTVGRVFGVERDQVNMTTLIALLVAAESVRRRSQRYKPSRRPNLGDWAIGMGVLRESVYGVAGPAASDTPLAGTLITLAILGGLVRPPAVRSARGIKTSASRLHQASLGRYGRLVGQSRRA